MRSVSFRSSLVVLFAIGSVTTVRAQVRTTTTTTATLTPNVAVPIVWTTVVEPVPVSPSVLEIEINSPTNQRYSKGSPSLTLARVQSGGQQIWRVLGFCQRYIAGVYQLAPCTAPLLDLTADVVLKVALDLSGSVKGALFSAFRPVGIVAPNQLPAGSDVLQATLIDGQSLLLSNGKLTRSSNALRLLIGSQIAAEWYAPMSRVLLYPSGQVGVLEEIGWKK